MKNPPNINAIMADYNLFLDIQMGKYFNSVNKKGFSNEDEARTITGFIVQTWNDEIAHQHQRLDNSTIEAKTAWFNSVEIKFKSKVNIHKISDSKPENRGAAGEMIDYYDELLPFLPEGAVMFLLFAGPAFEAYGYSLERYKKILDGEEPTPIEEELLNWGYDIAFGVMSAYQEKISKKRDLLLSASVKIAEEELDHETAEEVIEIIYSNIEENFAELHKEKNRKAGKKM